MFEDTAPAPNRAAVGGGMAKGAEQKQQRQITASWNLSLTHLERKGISGEPASPSGLLPYSGPSVGATEPHPALLTFEQEAVVAMAAH